MLHAGYLRATVIHARLVLHERVLAGIQDASRILPRIRIEAAVVPTRDVYDQNLVRIGRRVRNDKPDVPVGSGDSKCISRRKHRMTATLTGKVLQSYTLGTVRFARVTSVEAKYEL